MGNFFSGLKSFAKDAFSTLNPFSNNGPLATKPTPVYTPPTSNSLNIGQTLGSGGLTVDHVPTRSIPNPLPVQTSQSFQTSQPLIPLYTDTQNTVPRSFNVPVTNTVPSTHLSPGEVADLEERRRQKEAAMVSGVHPDGSSATNLIPSDSLYGQFANKLYQSSLYTPEEKSALQQYADATAEINAGTLAQRRKIQDLMENGTISKEQGEAFVSEAKRRSDVNLADIATRQSAALLSLDVLGKIRGNNTSALQSVSDFLKPEQVSPGSTLYNPLTGVSYQGSGASPQALFQTAQTIKENDQMTGNLHLTPQGTVDDNYYYQQAQIQLGGPSFNLGSQNVGGGIQTSQGLPANLQPYVVQSSTGQAYINEDKLPTTQKDFAKQQAALAGIPVFSTGEVETVRNIDYVKQNIQGMESVINTILSPGLKGRAADILLNPIKNALQTNTDITSFTGYRDTAIKIIQSLAGGPGSGLRLTGGEIATAINNIPAITDNLETAQKKIKLLDGFLDTKLSTLFVNGQTSQGGGIVNTKAGAINTDW